jgi:hypothetical protein
MEGSVRYGVRPRIRYNGVTNMGKVHPDIVDAREQYSCEQPIYDFLYRNLRGPAIMNRNAAILIIVLTVPLLTALPGGFLIIGVIFILGLKLFLYDLPAWFHRLRENGLMQFIFISDIDSKILWKDIFYLMGPMSIKKVRDRESMLIGLFIVIIIYISPIFINYRISINLVLAALQNIIIWLIFVEWGVCCIYLPGWVYKSGSGVFGMIFTVIFAYLMAKTPIWFYMPGMISGDNEMLLRTNVFMLLYTIVLGAIAFIGWVDIPLIVNMRRRGMFDEK